MTSKCRGGCDRVLDRTQHADVEHEVECLALKLDRYEQLLATAYQLAGLVGAPVRFLDAYALHDGTDADSLLPVGLDEFEEFKALASRLGAVEDELRHSVSVMSIVRSWLMENVRGSTHWENCEREHATCRAISQLGGVVERLSRLDLTAGGVERREPEIGDPVS